MDRNYDRTVQALAEVLAEIIAPEPDHLRDLTFADAITIRPVADLFLVPMLPGAQFATDADYIELATEDARDSVFLIVQALRYAAEAKVSENVATLPHTAAQINSDAAQLLVDLAAIGASVVARKIAEDGAIAPIAPIETHRTNET